MNDLISKQDAIEALCNDYCGGHQDCKYYPKCENLKSIQKLPSANQWIQCSERLPDKGLRVLIQLDNAWQVVGWYDEEDKQWYALPYEEPINELTYSKVIAWLPLPQYESEED